MDTSGISLRRLKTFLTNLENKFAEKKHSHASSDITGLDNALLNKAQKDHKHTVSQITDFPASLPASDVHEWAKATNKPTYTASEVGALEAVKIGQSAYDNISSPDPNVIYFIK